MKLERYPLLMPHDFDNVILHVEKIYEMEYIFDIDSRTNPKYSFESLREKLIDLMATYEYGLNYFYDMLCEFDKTKEEDDGNRCLTFTEIKFSRMMDVLLRTRYFRLIFEDKISYMKSHNSVRRMSYLYNRDFTCLFDSMRFGRDSEEGGIKDMNFLPHKCIQDESFMYMYDGQMAIKEFGLNIIKEENDGDLQLYAVGSKIKRDVWSSFPYELDCCKFEFQEK